MEEMLKTLFRCFDIYYEGLLYLKRVKYDFVCFSGCLREHNP